MRAWWAHRQGLDGSLDGQSPMAVLEQSGWARSVGGVNPYLTLFSRAGTSRQAAEAAAGASIQELPAARGCTYVVPESDYPLALRCSRDAAEAPLKVVAKLGVTEKEVDTLCEAIWKALAGGPLEPDVIREGVGAAARSMGPEGVKKGITTTVPLGLGRLQSAGRIRRIPTNGRLDQQRYKYERWDVRPADLSDEEAYSEVARRFFRWTGGARQSEFQWFSGLSGRAAKAALAPLNLAPLEEDFLILPEDLDAYRAFTRPKKPQVQLLASIDSLIHHRRDHRSLLDNPDTLPAEIGRIADLPSHAITDRGQLIGLWEYDPGTSTIAWQTFEKPTPAVTAAVKHMESFITEQLGDARSFSLDSPKSRAPRLAALRAGW